MKRRTHTAVSHLCDTGGGQSEEHGAIFRWLLAWSSGGVDYWFHNRERQCCGKQGKRDVQIVESGSNMAESPQPDDEQGLGCMTMEYDEKWKEESGIGRGDGLVERHYPGRLL